MNVRPDGVKLGDGNLGRVGLIDHAKAVGVKAVIVETHRTWVGGSPVASLQRSAEFLHQYLVARAS
jgi:sugar phosphate isomerase/epimerase